MATNKPATLLHGINVLGAKKFNNLIFCFYLLCSNLIQRGLHLQLHIYLRLQLKLFYDNPSAENNTERHLRKSHYITSIYVYQLGYHLPMCFKTANFKGTDSQDKIGTKVV